MKKRHYQLMTRPNSSNFERKLKKTLSELQKSSVLLALPQQIEDWPISTLPMCSLMKLLKPSSRSVCYLWWKEQNSWFWLGIIFSWDLLLSVEKLQLLDSISVCSKDWWWLGIDRFGFKFSTECTQLCPTSLPIPSTMEPFRTELLRKIGWSTKNSPGLLIDLPSSWTSMELRSYQPLELPIWIELRPWLSIKSCFTLREQAWEPSKSE